MGDNVYLFIPNLIGNVVLFSVLLLLKREGYARVIFLGLSIFYCFKSYYLYFLFYGLSQILDAFDGYAARIFDQSTKYGAVLDMITDRASTACLAIALGRMYSEEVALGMMAMIAVDMMSHYAILYSSLSRGQGSHKDTDNLHPILKIYYGSRPVLFTLCLGQEAFLMFMYLAKMMVAQPNPYVTVETITYLMYISLPLFLIKQFMNVLQLKQAMTDIVAIDKIQRAGIRAKKN